MTSWRPDGCLVMIWLHHESPARDDSGEIGRHNPRGGRSRLPGSTRAVDSHVPNLQTASIVARVEMCSFLFPSLDI